MRLYRRIARLSVAPALGKTQVRRLPAGPGPALAGMGDARKKPNSVRQVHVVLSRALAQSVRWGWCPANVARWAGLQPSRDSDRTADRGRDAAAIEAAEKRNPTLATLVMLAALIGARRGERKVRSGPHGSGYWDGWSYGVRRTHDSFATMTSVAFTIITARSRARSSS